MKKLLLIGCFIFITACQSADATPAPESTPTAAALPTPAPATSTPAIPTPTDIPPPTPIPRYFTDDFTFPSSYWEFFQTGGTFAPSAVFENDRLRVDIPSADTWWMGIHTAHTYTDVFVRAKVSAGTSGAVGLICRYSEAFGWYEFNVASDGTYNMLYGKWLAPEVAQYIPLVTGGSNHLNTGGLDYELGLSCRGNFLNLYANDALIRRVEVTNFGLVEGNIGITASSYREAPMIVLFDWVRVEEE
jgi:hypothetical protein